MCVEDISALQSNPTIIASRLAVTIALFIMILDLAQYSFFFLDLSVPFFQRETMCLSTARKYIFFAFNSRCKNIFFFKNKFWIRRVPFGTGWYYKPVSPPLSHYRLANQLGWDFSTSSDVLSVLSVCYFIRVIRMPRPHLGHPLRPHTTSWTPTMRTAAPPDARRDKAAASSSYGRGVSSDGGADLLVISGGACSGARAPSEWDHHALEEQSTMYG